MTKKVQVCNNRMSETKETQIELGEWLEDSKGGGFSRYATTPEESTWVCNNCEATGGDPYEDGCENCEAEADGF